MPFFIAHDSQLGDLAGLAANAGMYRTQREDQQMALAQQAEALRAQQAQDEIDHQHVAEAANVANLIATDRRQRDLMGQRSDLAYGLQGMRDESGMARAQFGQQGRADLATANQAALNYRNDQNNQTRAGIADQSNATRVRGQDLTAGAAYDRMDLARELQDRKERAAAALRMIETAEQAARAQNREDHATRLAQTHATIRVKLDELHENERRAMLGDPAAQARIGQINNELKGLVDAIVPPRQQAAGAAPGALDANGNVPYGMRPPIPQAQQPAAPPPQAVPSMGGANLSPVSAPMSSAQPVRVRTRDEALSLAPGTLFQDPYGVVRQA